MGKKKKKKDKKEKNQAVQTTQNSETPTDKVGLTRKWIEVAVLLIICTSIVILSLFWIPGDVTYDFKETYSFSVDQAGQIKLMLLLPTSGPYQTIEAAEIVWPGEQDHYIDGRLNVIFLQTDVLAGQTIEAEITYRVMLWQGEARWSGMPALSDDLSPEINIQSDHPDMIAQAEQLLHPQGKWQTARNIFRFTFQHLRWPQETRINANLSALNAWQTGVGGCTEHANLMTALCRAVDIPAHPVSGLLMPQMISFIPYTATWNHPAGAHAWVEFYSGGTWFLADSAISGKFLTRNLFGWTDGKHLVYDEIAHENEVSEQWISAAEEEGEWIAAMSAPMRFVAWSDVDIEAMQFIPQVTLRKVWDERVILMISLVVIVIVLYWLAKSTSPREKRKRKTR